MATKSFEIEDIGTVHVHRRRGTKNVRLSIGADGKIKVTVPWWASYDSGIKFVRTKSTWIQLNMPVKAMVLTAGMRIGKAHRLVFETTDTSAVRTRLVGSEIRILKPLSMSVNHSDVQTAAEKACIRALRMQAAKLLPIRLRELAEKYQFTFGDVKVKQLKGRWGSCDQHGNITLNLFLMQLPWTLIDYVLVHELTHTKFLDHSSNFWDEFLRHEPKAKYYRKQIRTYKPILEAIVHKPAVA